MININIEKLDRDLTECKNLKSLSNSFSNINNALNKACNNFYKTVFDYKFSTYLYREYILYNKTKYEIAKQLDIPSSTVYYYIKKYNLKKDRALITANLLESTKRTCNKKYNVDHPGELKSAHKKRINNILTKTNGNYNKQYYNKLNRSQQTLNRMKISQQNRRKHEKLEGDKN